MLSRHVLDPICARHVAPRRASSRLTAQLWSVHSKVWALGSWRYWQPQIKRRAMCAWPCCCLDVHWLTALAALRSGATIVCLVRGECCGRQITWRGRDRYALCMVGPVAVAEPPLTLSAASAAIDTETAQRMSDANYLHGQGAGTQLGAAGPGEAFALRESARAMCAQIVARGRQEL